MELRLVLIYNITTKIPHVCGWKEFSMKKVAILLLIVTLMLGAFGCGEEEKSAQSTQPDPTISVVQGEGFRVGFGRASITPQENLPLGGYGTSNTRIMEDVLDELYVDCVAITDENDATMLLMLVDLQRIEDSLIEMLRMSVNQKTNIPMDRIIISCSHTHSIPDLTMGSHEGISRYKTLLLERFSQAAEAALRDSCPADMFGGTTQTDGMSFVRHYYNVTEDGKKHYFGDSFGTVVMDETTSHVAEPMESMRVLRFAREGAKDVVICSFQAHPHMTGGTSVTDLSSDYVGPFREAVEYELDVYCSFIQGTGGDLNERSRLEEENFSVEKNHREYGYRLANYLIDCVENNMTQLKTGPVQFKTIKLNANVDHSQDHKVADAMLVTQFFNQTGNHAATREYAAQFGISSTFHANAIRTKAKMGATHDIEIANFAIGNAVGFYVAPGELFAQTGKEMEAASPFSITIAVCLADGDWKYFPYGVCAEYASYESDYCRFTPDTIVNMMDIWKQELQEMYDNAK